MSARHSEPALGVSDCEAIRAERDRARDLLARAVRLERWVSMGGINSHAKLAPIRRELWDSIVEELKR